MHSIDQAVEEQAETHVFIVHLTRFHFLFEMGAPAFSAVQWLKHVRRLRQQGCSRVVFASCFVHVDVWSTLAETLPPTEQRVPALMLAKMRRRDVLMDRDVLEWLGNLKWSDAFLGLGALEQSGIVEAINLRWKWLLL